MGILSNLVAGSIVTNIQYAMIRESHFVVKFGHDLMVNFTSHQSLVAFFEAYQSTDMSFTCILYFFCKQWGVLDLPMTDSFL